MIGTLIGILLTLLILGVIFWGIKRLLTVIPLDEPIATIVNVLLVVIVALIAIFVIVELLPAGYGPRWLR